MLEKIKVSKMLTRVLVLAIGGVGVGCFSSL